MSQISDRDRAHVDSIRKIFSLMDADEAAVLEMTRGVRAETERLSGHPVSDETAMAGLHRSRVIAGRGPHPSMYGLTDEMVERSSKWLESRNFEVPSWSS